MNDERNIIARRFAAKYSVTPAQAGVQNTPRREIIKPLDAGLRRHDEKTWS
ncbi:MAG: hypothetical protein P8101_09250 [Candidatus Thiodiazotropha sp.]